MKIFNLSNRLSLASLSIILVATVVFVCWLAQKNSKSFDQTVVEQTKQNLLTITEAQAGHLEGVFNYINRDLAYLSSNPVLHKRIISFDKSSELIAGDYDPLKEAFLHSRNIMGSMYQLDNRGIVQARVPLRQESIGADFSSKPGVQYILDNVTGKSDSESTCHIHISEIFKANSGRDVISICKPVFSDQKFIGILRSLVYLDTFGEMTKHISLGKSRYPLIIDFNSQIVSHPNKDIIGKSIVDFQSDNQLDADHGKQNKVIADMLNGVPGSDCFEFKGLSGKKVVLAWSPIHIGSEYWCISVLADYDEISESSRRHGQKVFIGSACIICVFFGLGIWFYRTSKEKERLSSKVRLAEETSRLKSQFLANISHEIRTPMNAIIGYSEIILESDSLDEVRKQSQTVLQQAELLLILINDLLDNAKIEAGKIELEKQPVDLFELTEKITSTFNMQAKSKGLKFNVSLDEDMPQYVIGDQLRLYQILANLASNAVKFTNEGTILLSVERISGNDDHNKLRFSVRDTGIGIDPKKQDMIFHSFTQADQSTTRQYGGTGLGTTISWQLVELMGGELAVQSELGEGSTFSFTLDMETAADPRGFNGHSHGSMDQFDSQTSHRGFIMVAEDFPANQQVIRLHLEKAGHKVLIAQNGKEAVAAVRENKFDLILMDIQMPEMDGFEATRLIRAADSSSIPILGLTANVDCRTKKLCREVGMDTVLTKPIRRNSLLASVNEWLGAESKTDGAKVVNRPIEAKNEVPFDLETAIEEFGDLESLQNIMTRFLKDMDNNIVAMKKALEKDDLDALKKISHSIKGGAGTLEAHPLADVAAELEQLSLADKKENIPFVFEQFKNEFNRLRKFVSNNDDIKVNIK